MLYRRRKKRRPKNCIEHISHKAVSKLEGFHLSYLILEIDLHTIHFGQFRVYIESFGSEKYVCVCVHFELAIFYMSTIVDRYIHPNTRDTRRRKLECAFGAHNRGKSRQMR